MTATRHAPGKLFVAGEYAVLDPGHPAILAAVDRRITVTVAALAEFDADVVIESDLRPAGMRLHWTGTGLGTNDEQRAVGGLTHVVSAIEVAARLLRERGVRLSPIRVSIISGLHQGGTKFGLGSSGAVTVATVDGVAAFFGVELSPEQRFRLAMLATAHRDAGSSGGDLAASAWGGWIAYRAPDRAEVLDLARRGGVDRMLRTPWSGFGLRRLPPPRGLAMEVGWTGQPASTAVLADRLAAGDWRGSASAQSFVERSDECVYAAIRALERGDSQELMHQIRRARHVLAALDDEVRLGIFTPQLTALCDAAEAVGGAGKPSGAGGGDCGIAFLDATATRAIAQLHEKWTAAGVRPIPIQVHSPNGSAE